MTVARNRFISVTVGICAYNEEQNIGKLLKALQGQETEVARIEEILVVASGCTDRTAEIVESVAESDARVRLMLQEERTGKASAIGEILRDALGEVVVLESADTIPGDHTIETLVSPFLDSTVGVVASHPVPVDDQRTFWGSITHALWGLHHEVSLQVPKTGEMFAFRSLVESIPDNVGADEDWIRQSVEKQGYRVVYQPDAFVYNAGPKTPAEFLKQRIRCNIQEVAQRRKYGISVPTWETNLVARAFSTYLLRDYRRVWPLLCFSVLELLARSYSIVRVALHPVELSVWESIPSTKLVDTKVVDKVNETHN